MRKSWVLVSVSPWNGEVPAGESRYPASVHWTNDDLPGSADGAYNVHGCADDGESMSEARACAIDCAAAEGFRLAFVEWGGAIVWAARQDRHGEWVSVRPSMLRRMSDVLARREAAGRSVPEAERSAACETWEGGGVCGRPAVAWERSYAYGACSYCAACAAHFGVKTAESEAEAHEQAMIDAANTYVSPADAERY